MTINQLNKKTKKTLIKSLKDLKCVLDVIDISSGQFKNQKMGKFSDVDFVIIVSSTKKDFMDNSFKKFLNYLLKRFTSFFPHGFIVLPEELLNDFKGLNLYSRKQFKSLLNSKIYKHQSLISQYEWLIISYLNMIVSFEEAKHKKSNKHFLRVKFHLSKIDNLLFELGFIQSKVYYPQTFDWRGIISLKIIISDRFQTLCNLLHIYSKNSIKKSEHYHFGKIIFLSKPLYDVFELLFIHRPIFRKLQMRTLPVSVLIFTQLFNKKTNLKNNNLFISAYNQRINFYKKWNKFIFESDLSSVVCQPIIDKIFR